MPDPTPSADASPADRAYADHGFAHHGHGLHGPADRSHAGKPRARLAPAGHASNFRASAVHTAADRALTNRASDGSAPFVRAHSVRAPAGHAPADRAADDRALDNWGLTVACIEAACGARKIVLRMKAHRFSAAARTEREARMFGDRRNPLQPGVESASHAVRPVPGPSDPSFPIDRPLEDRLPHPAATGVPAGPAVVPHPGPRGPMTSFHFDDAGIARIGNPPCG